MAMLDRLTLSQKLLVLILVPLLMVSYFSISQTRDSWSLRSGAAQLSELAAFGTRVSALVHELQKERGASAGFLGSKGAKFGPELAAQRKQTDARLAELRNFLNGFDAAAHGERIDRELATVMGQMDEIDTRRSGVDAFTLALGDALAYYTGMNNRFLGLVSELSKVSPDETIAIMTAAYANFLQSKERAGIERAVLSNTFARDGFGEGMFHRFLNLQTTQDNYMNVFLSLAGDEHKQFYTDTLKGEAVDETTRMRRLAMDRAETGGFETDPVYWFKMQTGKINLLKQVEDRLAADFVAAAAAVGAQANMALMANLSLAVLGIALTLLLGWVLARNILHQLGGEPAYIAEIADHIAHGELDTPLRDERAGRRSGIYASIVSMRDNLRERINADRKAAEETQRIKTALDCVSTNVMVADGDFNIIYANSAVQAMFREAESDLRERLPAFDADDLLGNNIDLFHANPAHQRGLLEKMQGTYQSEVKVGPRTFRIIANPVVDGNGHRLGTAVEWADLTAELRAAEEEAARLEEERRHAGENLRIKTALDNASSCVMMADTDLNVIYLNEAARQLFGEVESDFRGVLAGFDSRALVGRPVAQLYTNGIGQRQLLGSLEQRNEAEVAYGGRTMKVVANPVFNDRREKLGYAIEWTDRTDEVAVENEVSAIVAEASRGNLRERIDLKGKHGFFRRLSEGVNQMIDVVDTSLGDIASAMQRLSQGDLTQTITRDYEGTFGQVKEAVNGTVGKLDELVASLRESSDTVSTAAGEIASGNTNLSQRTEQNAASLEETAASVEQLAATVRNNADNAQQADRVAHMAREQAQLGGEVVSRAIEAMREINVSSGRIAEIIGVIDEIAFQTNLLALNASVEAARAGEQGRGFAVVATEVRNLAGRSATAAKEIKELINDSVNKVHSGSELVNDSGGKLEEIVVSVKKVADIVAEISAASVEQSAGIDQINQAVTSMDEGTQQNAALAEQTSAAASALDDRAREMQSIIAFFRTRGGTRPAAATAAAAVKPAQAPPGKPLGNRSPGTRPAVAVPARPAAAPPPPAPVAQGDDDDEWETF